jgi:plastocyanin
MMKTLHYGFGVVALLALLAPAARAEGWGTVKGQVTYAGEAPKEAVLDVNKDKDHCLKDGPIHAEDLVVDPKTKGVANVFVWLAPEEKGKKLPINPALATIKDKNVTIDQPECRFIPHALAMRKGQTLIVKNSAPVAHNTNYQGGSANPGQNLIVPAGKSIEVKNLVASTTPVNVTCNIHGWMKGFIRVFDHPYYAVTKPDGTFEIKDAPAGKFRLIVWQESVGWVGPKEGKEIDIKADGVTEEKIEMKAK